jgi:hypothetical protein
MPTISAFYGIIVRMYWKDHAPPHFHVEFGGARAVVSIVDLSITRGHLPSRATRLILEWAEMHRQELIENWELCAKGLTPRTIQALE